MSPQRAKELLPIIQAFAEGKQIQYSVAPRHPWHDLGPSANFEGPHYRVKPAKIHLHGWLNIYPTQLPSVFSFSLQMGLYPTRMDAELHAKPSRLECLLIDTWVDA